MYPTEMERKIRRGTWGNGLVTEAHVSTAAARQLVPKALTQEQARHVSAEWSRSCSRHQCSATSP